MADGLFGEMADKVGYPWNHVPPKAFTVAAGGYAGLGSLCGALGTATAFIGTVCDTDTQKKVVADLFRWYESAEFPSYQPGGMNLKTTVAESTLCEVSVMKFMAAEDVKYGDAKRKERCAGVTAEVAKKTIELLNAAI